MSNSKDIKDRQRLQATLQAAFSEKAARVEEWLGSASDSGPSTDLSESRQAFLKLPVVQIGGGLRFDTQAATQDTNSIHTLGDFVTGNKSLSTLAKKKQAAQPSSKQNSIYRVDKEDTKAMVALKQKMKNQRRSQLHERIVETAPSETPAQERGTADDDDSDDSDEAPVEKMTKKKVGLLFLDKKRKR
ncbi:AER300Cp [Eremothecium gossypii ATCC 10895]|uniref:AER300Cp n=1 Tax=Eremothecium gossypii (strain ATCC 10895 / CBS 109.51 / FGSC 9923 / NRRL Y-1056) TaxID=284811 RepID=Q756G6_EREGS|nr:AER300Cp [Eremothecium gossypii ATCC 10895]AAS52981.1 AER300Cp [Eremothecium gossypii ATCC 10895]AEY97289.1 FAER300Cp [Eremothecium gossypii FDAG1]